MKTIMTIAAGLGIGYFVYQYLTSNNGGKLNGRIHKSAMTELPAMILFSRFSRKGRGIRLFMVSIWCWLARDLLTLLAPNPAALFAVQLLNFVSVAVYVPGMMDYMRHVLPASQLLRGATLAGTATTLGSLLATILGGWLMDSVGVRQALMIVQFFAAGGTVLLTVALGRAIRQSKAA